VSKHVVIVDLKLWHLFAKCTGMNRREYNNLPGVKSITAFIHPHSLPSGDNWRNLPIISWEMNSGLGKKTLFKHACALLWKISNQGITCKENSNFQMIIVRIILNLWSITQTTKLWGHMDSHLIGVPWKRRVQRDCLNFFVPKTIPVFWTRSWKWDKPCLSSVTGPYARSTKWGRLCLGSVSDLDSRLYLSHVAYLYSEPRNWNKH
jgi:hypothetical protein